MSEEKLVALLSKDDGVVLLTHEHEHARGRSQCRRGLFGDNSACARLLLGMLEAKGLDFPEVDLVDDSCSASRTPAIENCSSALEPIY